MPRVSVIIPVYNRADRCQPSLDSALAQTYHDFEVVVVDDGSTDDLAGVLSSAYPSVRTVRLAHNAGVAVARNTGVTEAHGELIAFLDSDDLWSPDKLMLQVEDYDRHQEAVLAFTDITFGPTGVDRVYSKTQPFQPDRVFEQLLEGGPILPSCVLVRKRDFVALGGFHPALPPAEDRDLWLRFAGLGSFRFLPLPLVRRVVYHDALSHRPELWESTFNRVVSRFLERPEGATYRRRAHVLHGFQFVKMGSRYLRAQAWRLAISSFSRATWRDPLAVFRASARPLVADAAAAGIGRVVGRYLGGKAQRAFVGLIRGSPRAPAASFVPETMAAFRPPPDAPERP